MTLKNYRLVWNYRDVPAVMDKLTQAPRISLDLETTGLDHNRHTIHGIALATRDQEWYVTHSAADCLLDSMGVLADKTVAMHNAPFDLHFLHRRGIKFPNVRDTMVAQYLVDENQGLGLKELARNQLGISDPLPGFGDLLNLGKALTGKARKEYVDIYDLPLDIVGEYAARDARMTYDLLDLSEGQLSQEGMLEYYLETEMPFTRIIVAMEEAGFFIDQARLVELETEFGLQRDHHLAKWLEITGGVNPNSPDQVGTYLYETLGYKPSIFTKSGAPSVDALSLLRLLPLDKNGAVEALSQYRKLEKLLSTYIYGFRDRLYNGYLFGRFNHVGTVTGRLSSSDPNLQNIPAHGEAGGQVRELFAAPPGYAFINIDYSQLELRIATHYTQDPTLMKIFIENLDPHQITADMIGAPRFIGKTINFSWFYGAGARKMADTIEKSGKPRPNEKDVKAWITKFEQAYPKARQWKDRVVMYAKDLGYVKTIAGRKRRLPLLYSDDFSESNREERRAINSIIQGSASDITKWAMLQIFPVQDSYGASMLAQVHDELDFVAPETSAKEFSEYAANKMRMAGEKFNMRVALIAEPGLGKNWSEAKH